MHLDRMCHIDKSDDYFFTYKTRISKKVGKFEIMSFLVFRTIYFHYDKYLFIYVLVYVIEREIWALQKTAENLLGVFPKNWKLTHYQRLSFWAYHPGPNKKLVVLKLAGRL